MHRTNHCKIFANIRAPLFFRESAWNKSFPIAIVIVNWNNSRPTSSLETQLEIFIGWIFFENIEISFKLCIKITQYSSTYSPKGKLHISLDFRALFSFSNSINIANFKYSIKHKAHICEECTHIHIIIQVLDGRKFYSCVVSNRLTAENLKLWRWRQGFYFFLMKNHQHCGKPKNCCWQKIPLDLAGGL